MNILQHTLCIVWRHDTEIFLPLCIPELWQLLDCNSTFHQPDLQLETKHNMQIVGGFVCIDADQGRLYPVDRFVERLQTDAIQLGRKAFLEGWIKMLPERQGSSHQVLP